MPEEPVFADLTRWMPNDVAAASRELEDQLLEVWMRYIQTIGPSVVLAYRTNKLKVSPHVHVFDRVSDTMQRIAVDLLLEEEMQQDRRNPTETTEKTKTS